MAAWPAGKTGALLLLAGAILGATGQKSLEAPWNLQLSGINADLSLTWSWHNVNNEDNFGVKFSTFYQEINRRSTIWKNVIGCLNIPSHTCNFTVSKKQFNKRCRVRVRAEKLEETSLWSNPLLYTPASIVQIGPPAVNVKPIDGGIEVNISAPGADLESKLWSEEELNYIIVLWQNGSNKESIVLSHMPFCTLTCLVPGGTYCLKVQAELSGGLKHGLFSPVTCFKNDIKGSDGEPHPQNLRVEALNLNYVLKWDWNSELGPNVTFSVELLRMYEVCDPDAWSIIEGCKNILSSECDLSDLFVYGRYVFRVSAFSGNNKSLSSTVQFSPLDDTLIGPPNNVTAKITNNLLIVAASDPDIGTISIFKWTYHLVIWPISSDAKVDHYNGTIPYFTIKNWKASTTYCFKIQVYEGTRLGLFSKEQCITTPPGSTLTLWIIIIIIMILIVMAVIALSAYLCICLLQRHMQRSFFHSGKLPSSIETGMFDSPVNHRFLLQQEEPTDMCYIINNIRNEELAQKDFYPQSSSTRDSGNYSNEEESTGDQTLIIQ